MGTAIGAVILTVGVLRVGVDILAGVVNGDLGFEMGKAIVNAIVLIGGGVLFLWLGLRRAGGRNRTTDG